MNGTDSRGKLPGERGKARPNAHRSKADVQLSSTGGNTAALFAQLIDAPDPATLARMRQAWLDATSGIRSERRYRKQRLFAGEQEEERERARTCCPKCKHIFEPDDAESVWIYTSPPDTKLLGMILEQNLGKPALRPHEAVDPIITVVTAVPGYTLDGALEGKGGSPAAFVIPAGEEAMSEADPLDVPADLMEAE